MHSNFTRPQTGWTRREFVKTALASGLALAAAPSSLLAAETKGDMPYRPLGRTGEKVSAIGLGGYHIGVSGGDDDALRLIRSAVDHGINFLDNCWDYNAGDSETRMGKALQDGYRDKVFLMTKIDGRTRELAAKQIDESLRRLKTDHVDLMQFHEIIRVGDPDRVFAKGGAMEAVLDAKKAGKIRFIGFTGHKEPSVQLRMLDAAEKNGIRIDAVQMPLNVMDAHFQSFAKQVVPRLVKDGIGVLGMKPMGFGYIPRTGIVTGTECLHYALNLPTSTVITGMENSSRLDQAVEAARTFKPLSDDQLSALLARTADAARDGRYEPFKTGSGFDGTTQHPEWMG
jgi:aryl-alcohol dehydrogenase-like predicted oxidoreductase